jgi:hypothetical protein
MAEKDGLLQELDACRAQLNISRDKVLDITEGMALQTQHKYVEDIKVSVCMIIYHCSAEF